jgi:hypothetical protein
MKTPNIIIVSTANVHTIERSALIQYLCVDNETDIVECGNKIYIKTDSLGHFLQCASFLENNSWEWEESNDLMPTTLVVLNYNTGIVDIINIQIEDASGVDILLSENGYNLDGIHYMIAKEINYKDDF